MPATNPGPSRSRGSERVLVGAVLIGPDALLRQRPNRSSQGKQVRPGILEMPRVPCDHSQAADNCRRRNLQVDALVAHASRKPSPFASFRYPEGQNTLGKQQIDLRNTEPQVGCKTRVTSRLHFNAAFDFTERDNTQE